MQLSKTEGFLILGFLYVEVDLRHELPHVVPVQLLNWHRFMQLILYEWVPYHCKKCYGLRHLDKDCKHTDKNVDCKENCRIHSNKRCVTRTSRTRSIVYGNRLMRYLMCIQWGSYSQDSWWGPILVIQGKGLQKHLSSIGKGKCGWRYDIKGSGTWKVDASLSTRMSFLTHKNESVWMGCPRYEWTCKVYGH